MKIAMVDTTMLRRDIVGSDATIPPTLVTTARISWPRILAWTAVVVVGLFLALWLDGPAYRLLVDREIEVGAQKMSRSIGYLPTWIFVAVAMLLIDAKRFQGQPFRKITRRAELIFWPPVLAGILAAVLQVLLRRERPSLNDGEYVFRAFSERPFDGGGLGLPSGDVSVAFASAFMLIRMYPAATPVWIVMGLCSVLSRLLEGDHFLSDAYVAAVVGFLCAWLVWVLNERTQRGASGAGSSLG